MQIPFNLNILGVEGHPSSNLSTFHRMVKKLASFLFIYDFVMLLFMSARHGKKSVEVLRRIIIIDFIIGVLYKGH